MRALGQPLKSDPGGSLSGRTTMRRRRRRRANCRPGPLNHFNLTRPSRGPRRLLEAVETGPSTSAATTTPTATTSGTATLSSCKSAPIKPQVHVNKPLECLRNTALAVQLLFLLVTQLAIIGSPHSESSAELVASPADAPQPGAHLAKLGYIRGLRFDAIEADAAGKQVAETNGSTSARRHRSVGAFLGIPYAAPPTHSLRFMPPGAARSQLRPPTAPSDPLHGAQCLWLAPEGGHPVPARPMARPGPECVRLADWLPATPWTGRVDTGEQAAAKGARPAQASSDQIEANGTSGSAKTIANRDDRLQLEVARDTRRRRQSEDCLNLNVFVPFDSFAFGGPKQQQQQVQSARSNGWRASGGANNYNDNSPGRVGSNNNPIESMGQQIKSNYPSQESREHQHGQDNHNSINQDQANYQTRLSANQSPLGDNGAANGAGSSCSLVPLAPASAKPGPTSGHSARLPVLVLFQSIPDANNSQGAPSEAPPLNGHQKWSADSAAHLFSHNQHDSVHHDHRHLHDHHEHLQLAHRAQTIVITFNFRIGLMGFLPYIDTQDEADGLDDARHQHHSPASKITFGRQNHATWDQIGLLHWLRHNIASFNGDPDNISLVALDSRASQSIQLLAMSPLTKGLFKRMVLIEQLQAPESQQSKGSLMELVALSARSRRLRPQLINQLALIVRQQHLANTSGSNLRHRGASSDRDNQTLANAGHDDTPWILEVSSASEIRLPRQVFAYIQSAGLQQLAQLELELGRSSNGQLLVQLVSQPNLDDRLLFPQFADLFRQMTRDMSSIQQDDPPAGGSPKPMPTVTSWLMEQLYNQTKLNPANQVQDYCSYVRRLQSLLMSKSEAAKFQELARVAINGTNSNSFDPALISELNSQLARLDPLGLIPRAYPMLMLAGSPASGSNTTGQLPLASYPTGWRRTKSSQGAGDSQAEYLGRLEAAQDFAQLRQLKLLNSLLMSANSKQDATNEQYSTWVANVSGSMEDNELASGLGDEDDEDEDSMARNSQRQKSLLAVGAAQAKRRRKRSQHQISKRAPNNDFVHPKEQQIVQLAASIGSYDLMLGFIAELAPASGTGTDASSGPALNQAPAANESSFANIVSVLEAKFASKSGPWANQMLQADEFLSWLLWAELHSSGRRPDGSTCLNADQLASPSGAQSDPLAVHKTEGSYVFVWPMAPSDRRQAPGAGWLLDLGRQSSEQGSSLVDQVANFVRSGSPTTNPAAPGADPQQWPSYVATSRHLKWLGEPMIGQSSVKQAMRHWLWTKLELEPWLVHLSRSGRPNITSNNGSASQTSGPFEGSLLKCLEGIDSLVAKQSAKDDHEETDIGPDTLSCLANLTQRLRNQLRSTGSAELGPIWSRLAHLGWPPLVLHRGPKGDLWNHSGRPQMSARNLVNPSDWWQASNDEPAPGGHLFAQLHQLDANGQPVLAEIELANGTSLADLQLVLADERHQSMASRRNSSQLAGGQLNNQQQHQHQRSSGSALAIRQLWSRAQNFAIGQALSVVVGTGLAIFLINLLIVFAVIRSARRSRQRLAQGQEEVGAEDQLGLVELKANNGLDTQGSTTNVGHQHACFGATGVGQEEPQLVSSFRSSNGARNQLAIKLDNDQDARLAGGGHQRAGKSIKFDLSGLDDHDDHGCLARMGGDLSPANMMDPRQTNDQQHQHQSSLVLDVEKLCPATPDPMNENDMLRMHLLHATHGHQLENNQSAAPNGIDPLHRQPEMSCSSVNEQVLFLGHHTNWPVQQQLPSTRTLSNGADAIMMLNLEDQASQMHLMTATNSSNSTDLTAANYTCHHHQHHSQQPAQMTIGGSLTSPFGSTTSSTATSLHQQQQRMRAKKSLQIANCHLDASKTGIQPQSSSLILNNRQQQIFNNLGTTSAGHQHQHHFHHLADQQQHSPGSSTTLSSTPILLDAIQLGPSETVYLLDQSDDGQQMMQDAANNIQQYPSVLTLTREGKLQRITEGPVYPVGTVSTSFGATGVIGSSRLQRSHQSDNTTSEQDHHNHHQQPIYYLQKE